MAEKDESERRVYVLPKELVERIRAFQSSNSISSEVEAVRRLLDSALQMRDTLEDVMKKLLSRYNEEKDIRVLSSEVLIHHPLVTEVKFNETGLEFRFQGNVWGQLNKTGRAAIGDGNDEGWVRNWSEFPKRPETIVRRGGWDSPKGGKSDLDDDIPF